MRRLKIRNKARIKAEKREGSGSESETKKRKRSNSDIGSKVSKKKRRLEQNLVFFNKASEAINNGNVNDFLNAVESVIANKGLKSQAYSQLTIDNPNHRRVLINLETRGQRVAWINSLGKGGRALQLAELDAIGDSDKIRELGLETLYIQLNSKVRVDDAGKSGGVGAPGFTTINIQNAAKATAKDIRVHIRDQILGDKGEQVRQKIRKKGKISSEYQKGLDDAAALIMAIEYPVNHLLEGEIHAVGVANDVLAGSLYNNKKHAAPYTDLAIDLDRIIEDKKLGDANDVASIIAYYAGFTDVLPEGITTEILQSIEGAKLREFATVQITEKGRELKRIQEVGEETKDDLQLVEKALIAAARDGFTATYAQKNNKNAIFANKGGQDALRERYAA
ncbi:hypothetical protein [Aquimarina sp. RZ0]|uniref:hypothetical protein n=1 Tax=Aquimarina sp. RZ0 TaxID=2607730 RepID=UPI0011F180A4|nr:hypothetical protein [Aquimarina sp. RZ0]KAA1247918.1 hypothetical protein F0000_01480 [Aquimarina sp. RZ0]